MDARRIQVALRSAVAATNIVHPRLWAQQATEPERVVERAGADKLIVVKDVSTERARGTT
jgi:hypothetical protein